VNLRKDHYRVLASTLLKAARMRTNLNERVRTDAREMAPEGGPEKFAVAGVEDSVLLS
jgi:hypothetical protein